MFDENHLTDEERAQFDGEVEESEKTILKTITVKSKPSRRPLDITGLPEKAFHIYPDGGLDGKGHLRAEYVEIGTDVPSREEAGRGIYPQGCLPQGHPQIRHRDKISRRQEDTLTGTSSSTGSQMYGGAFALSDIIVGKFVYHLPSYRLIQQYMESGITVSDATMGGWYEAEWRSSSFCTTSCGARYSQANTSRSTRAWYR